GSTVPDAIRERAWFSETRDPVAGPVRRRWGGMGVVPQPERSEGVASGRWWAGGSRPDTIRLPPRCFDSRVPAQPASTPTLGGYGGSSPNPSGARESRVVGGGWEVGLDTIRLPPRCFDSRDPAQPARTPTLGGYGGVVPHPSGAREIKNGAVRGRPVAGGRRRRPPRESPRG